MPNPEITDYQERSEDQKSLRFRRFIGGAAFIGVAAAGVMGGANALKQGPETGNSADFEVVDTTDSGNNVLKDKKDGERYVGTYLQDGDTLSGLGYSQEQIQDIRETNGPVPEEGTLFIPEDIYHNNEE